jgi:hypothetical protein
MLELGDMVLNCPGRSARSILEDKERLYKLPIERIDEGKVLIECRSRV